MTVLMVTVVMMLVTVVVTIVSRAGDCGDTS
jgi:hypothetical protein